MISNGPKLFLSTSHVLPAIIQGIQRGDQRAMFRCTKLSHGTGRGTKAFGDLFSKVSRDAFIV